jgi:DNA-binding IclR family transcriptional regulator
MSSLSRALALLGLFSADHPDWPIDDMIDALGYTRATGYRYVKELVEAGFLQKVSAGHYALGARIIELDYQLRASDPVLRAAVPVMEALVRRSRLDAVLTTMVGQQVIDTHRVSGDAALELAYGRGRPRPMLRGSAAKVLVAWLPRAALLRLYAQHAEDIARWGLGSDWTDFRARLTQIRQAGFCVAYGELEADRGSAAVPLLDAEGHIRCALSLVGTPERLRQAGEPRLKAWLSRAAAQVAERLNTTR